MSYDEALALYTVSNWAGTASKAVAEAAATQQEIKDMLRGLWSVLDDAGVR